jgi:hypothetical protein
VMAVYATGTFVDRAKGIAPALPRPAPGTMTKPGRGGQDS